MTSNPSHLRELDLSTNQSPTDADVELLSSAMMHPNCRLETLRLSCCSLSKISCDSLASALRSNPSHLRVLDLSENQLKDSGLKLLCSGLESLNCKLEALRLSSCRLSEISCDSLASALRSNPSHLRFLDLDPLCELETLRLSGCSLSEISCDSLASALRSNPSHLKILDLSRNQLKDPGVKLLCGFLQDPLCELEVLRWLHSSQKPKPASLLKGQQVEQKPPAEKVLSERKWWRTMKLAKLHLSSRDGLSWSCGTRYRPEEPPTNKLFSWEERALSLSSVCLSLVALKSNHSHLRVLDLSHNTLQDSGVKRLCSGLESPNCKLARLRLIDCRLTEISCGSLASALRSNPSHLRKLDLSWNQLKDPGVKRLCGFLHSPNCRLETLRLRSCSLSEISCGSLASALRSNPSHLRELDLSENQLKDSELKLLSDLVENPHYGLETLGQ
ncbi:Ribonuclease inhibitor [Takifugu flavidus]|uniref:Ribonuclease inhibitor n=1 Tax=Takifugu flavidus TaxID=433684 RepID=A0A5C6NMW5_9TELE|nr:Ribonuclease inhibitor [Takifugu flavidus]